jgi:ribosomal protein L11 methyltransferase
MLAEHMTRNWPTITIEIPSGDAEVVSAMCFALGSCGMEVDEREDCARLTVYFSEGSDLEVAEESLRSFVLTQGIGLMSLRADRLEEADWEAEWRRFFRPIWATPNVVIHPSWIPVDPGEGMAIIIDPKMAFGTGGHESTQLCLQALEPRIKSGCRVLDLGTGSGILSIAAVRWGAAYVTALDVDPAAIENARENLQRNGIDLERVDARVGRVDDCPETHPFDLIVANIQSHILLPILAELRRRLAVGGPIIFSGILAREETTFCAGLADAGFEVVEILIKNEWIGVVARRCD